MYYSTISLRLTSSTTSADTMISAVGMKPSSAWNKGESILLPRGRPFDSPRKQSFAAFDLLSKDKRPLPELILECTRRLRTLQPFFAELKSEDGGMAELFIGWFLSRSGGDTLSSSLLLEVGSVGLDLSFDIYPADGTEEETDVHG
jgi:hypothetical protein